MTTTITRRAALVTVLAAPLTACAARAAETPLPAAPPDNGRIGGFSLGCQAYSFNRFTAWEAIEKTAYVGGKVIEFYPGQKLSREQPDLRLDHTMSDETLLSVKAKLAQHGVRPVAYGVVNLGTDASKNREVFRWAQKMGIGTLTAEPDPAGMDNIEKLVREFDIRVAIHNHPKRAGYNYWNPAYVRDLIKSRDRRIGSCADTGHWVRSGVVPVEALRLLKGRILQSHLKDLTAFAPDAHDVPYGAGVSNIAAILDELNAQHFDGNLSVEYEYHFEDSVGEIAQCIGFVRGYGGRG